MARTLADNEGTAVALLHLGNVAELLGDPEQATARYQECLPLFREQHDSLSVAEVLADLGRTHLELRDVTLAEAASEEALALARAHTSWPAIALALAARGEIALVNGNVEQAIEDLSEALTLDRERGDRNVTGHRLANLAHALRARHDDHRAAAHYAEALGVLDRVAGRRVVAPCLEGVAGLAAATHPEAAARLWGAAAVLRETYGPPVPRIRRAAYDRAVGGARATIGEEAFAAAWAAGRTLSFEEVIVEAQAIMAGIASAPITT